MATGNNNHEQDAHKASEESATTLSQRKLTEWIATAVARIMARSRQPTSLEQLRTKLLELASKEGLGVDQAMLLNEHLYEILDGLYWKGSERMKMVYDAVNAGFDAKKLKKVLDAHTQGPTVPQWVVEERMRAAKGFTHAPRKKVDALPRGMLRLDIADADLARIPAQSTFDNPIVLKEHEEDDGIKVSIISAPQIGLPFDKVIERNVTRCALSAARKLDSRYLIIGGPLLRIALVKASGPAKLLRDLIDATDMNVESFAPIYQAEARRLLESDTLEPIFATATELFEELVRGWYNVSVRTGRDGKVHGPEFTRGPVYIVLSPDDIGIVHRIAYFWLLYQQRTKLTEATAEMSLYNRIVREARKEITQAQRSGDEDRIKEATERLMKAEAERERALDLVNRTRVTGLVPQRDKEVIRHALAYFIEQIESKIPHARVVGQGEAFFKFGDKGEVVRCTCMTGNNPFYQVTDYGPRQRTGKLPAHTYVMHGGAKYFRGTARENYHDGVMKGAVHFYELPMLVDSERIRENVGNLVIPGAVTRALQDSSQQSGMVTVKWTKTLGLVKPEFHSTAALRRLGAPKALKKPAEVIWKGILTDQHHGGVNRVTIVSPNGIPMSIPEAAAQLLLRSGKSKDGSLPLATFEALDDQFQGEHFGNYLRPHHLMRPIAVLLQEAEHRLAGAGNGKRHTKRELTRMVEGLRLIVRRQAEQLWIRQPNNMTMQWRELIDGFLPGYAEMVAGILRRAQRANVVVRGVSHYTGAVDDMRDAGLIVLGSGNHSAKTLDYMLHEGPLVVDMLVKALQRHGSWSEEDLRKMVRAPLAQDQTIAYGTLTDATGYVWGLEYASTPPKRDSWVDVLHGWVQVSKKMGNPSSILGRPIEVVIHEAGDKHFFAESITNDGIYVMGPSSTHTDAFAWTAGGLPENNSGMSFLGLPVGGPDRGPIRYEHLDAKTIQEYITNGKDFPWGDLLVNPAGGWE